MVDVSQTSPGAVPQNQANRGAAAFPVDPERVVEGSKLWPAGKIWSKLFMYALQLRMAFAFLNG